MTSSGGSEPGPSFPWGLDASFRFGPDDRFSGYFGRNVLRGLITGIDEFHAAKARERRFRVLGSALLSLARKIGSSWDGAYALAGLGRCALAAGRTSDAEASLRQAQEIFRRIGAAEATGVTAELDAVT
jgi:hypothetical protein